MAKILYGVMGDASGHVGRASAISTGMPHHEFLFLGGGRARRLGSTGCRVEEIPMFSTCYSNNRVNVAATLSNGIRQLPKLSRTFETVVRIMADFQPDLVLSDYEFFTPIAARRLGIRCISIDHQHFLTKCYCPPVKGGRLSRFMFKMPLQAMYSHTDHFMITSFFPFYPKKPEKTEVFPPILGRDITGFVPREGNHLLVYQTSPTFRRLLPVLRRIMRPCIVYGVEGGLSSGNIVFKRFSRNGFLDDLSSCRYAITNGGHNVISEALYFGKPVLSFPIHLAYEQYVNAHMLASLEYGACSISPRPELGLFDAFEERLDRFRERIARGGSFFGTEKLIGRLEGAIREG
ncbi:MAG: hypothetical protein GY846_05445 [Deltaproteobacteria bacterium]|nr:hypothetical protein [Deltaproteobacteria bacterium]